VEGGNCFKVKEEEEERERNYMGKVNVKVGRTVREKGYEEDVKGM
jgi:hypothetical protein